MECFALRIITPITQEDPAHENSSSGLGLVPNAAAQPCLEAEARYERTLEGIGCSGLLDRSCLGRCPACYQALHVRDRPKVALVPAPLFRGRRIILPVCGSLGKGRTEG